ncbi:MAG: asparagine synthase-related protein [Candidatus Methanosuratincola sp.]|jgi:asparagine synthase (glutamine-hydrolysing)|uniref:Asparagine synthetase [glutamine-hydrolyzing] n=1 Tax=Methanosuratincola subterraneus TaxID=2593994 RepID=A0A3S3RM09_METS7|nr:asparagine synthase-related protein [Candidatus Methanosuratincola sp.]RWX72754.1 MAG: Asparagine synthetase [glutamine-hydrolyzing] [Candidatus Methanosuratincola subterraneus]
MVVGLEEKLRAMLSETVGRCVDFNTGILLSGGLDTSILAYEAAKCVEVKAYTVAMKGADAQDLKYARMVSDHLRLEHKVLEFGIEEVFEALPKLIKILGVFDPMEVRNSLAIYLGMGFAKEEGANTLLTGDGADELFAGYDFIINKASEEIEKELRHLWKVMTFSSFDIGKNYGISVKAPYLDEKIKKFAMGAGVEFKVGKRNGKLFGKWILRKAYEGLLPEEIIWRAKTPIERGTGTNILPSLFERKISDELFNERRELYFNVDSVRIRDKEQLVYYEVFREVIGPPEATGEGRHCPCCTSVLREGSKFCRTCGAYPV